MSRYGTPETGSPISAAIVGAEDLDASTRVYGDCLGLDVVAEAAVAGGAFESHWRLPPGSTGRVRVLGDRDCPVGRVMLIEFSDAGRERVRNIDGQCFFGLVNLNFYSSDIYATVARLEAAGCRGWSDPVLHDMGPVIGTPVEIMMDGPDSVILNIIELRAPNPEARINLTLSYIAENGGFNRRGSTAVATSQHCVSDYEGAMAFATEVLGMTIRNNTILKGSEMERFMQYPSGAMTRDTYVQGNHVFGKVAINHPLNFPCVDLVPRAVAPNVGYLAQSFVVPSLSRALDAAQRIGAARFSDPVEMTLPGHGPAQTAIVRNPGSGALQELVELS